MKTKEAINILNHAVEYYDMMYSSGDSKHDEGEKNRVWAALNHVADELASGKLQAASNKLKLDKHQAVGYYRSKQKGKTWK